MEVPCALPFVGAARQPSVFMCRSACRRRRRSSARKQRRRKKDDEEGKKKDKRVELTRWEANKQTRAARGGAAPPGVTLTARFSPRRRESGVSLKGSIHYSSQERRDSATLFEGRKGFNVLNAQVQIAELFWLVLGGRLRSSHWRDSWWFFLWSEGTYHSGKVCAVPELEEWCVESARVKATLMKMSACM